MAKKEQGVSGWEASARGTLRDLGVKDMPSFEVLFLDELAGWAFSIRNPGHGYNEGHGVLVVATLFGALERARSFRPAQAPDETEGIAATREKVVAGAHAFARKRKGVAHLAGLLAALAIPELEHSAGQPAAQTYWLFHYALLVLASGTDGEEDEGTLRGITEVFQAWDVLAAAGFVLPWRTRESMESQASADMVTSHVETLIKRLTGAEEVTVDPDGDYPIRYRNALYFVRVVPAWKPVVQIFSIAVDGIQFTEALARDLNEINAGLHFCRTFWVRGQVLVESEHLGPSLTEADFHECALHVAEATDAFAESLAERHGGRLAFEESKEPEYALPADERVGYL